MVEQGNLFRLPGRLPEGEVFETLAALPGCRVERIVSTGQATPPGEWYDQGHAEWVALLAGRAVLRFEGAGPIALEPGDWALIPARARHRVEATSAEPPCVWLAVHCGPEQGPGLAGS